MHRRVGGGVSRFFAENVLSHSTETLWFGKVCVDKTGVSRFVGEYVLTDSTEIFGRQTSLSFRKLLVKENVWDKKVGHLSRFSVDFALSRVTKNIS